MKRIFTVVVIMAALAFTAVAQDWYHDREERFRGEAWRARVFVHVRTDLEHIWSAGNAADREHARLDKTKEELTKMQADLDQGRWVERVVKWPNRPPRAKRPAGAERK